MKILKAFSQIIGAATLLCVFGFSAHAQVDDSIAFYNSRDTTLKYVSPLEYAFMMHEETKFMLRVPVFGVGAEVAILPYVTWMTQMYHPMFQMTSNNLLPDLYSEIRWYFGSRKLGIRSMSGNYLAAGLQIGGPLLYQESPDFGIYAKVGMQRRILGNGLADIGIVAGFAAGNKKGIPASGFFLQSPTALGLGLIFGERASLDRNMLCPVIKCYEKEHFLVKINFSNLIQYISLESPNGTINALFFNPYVAFEKKIFDSPFSLNADLALNTLKGQSNHNELGTISMSSSYFEWNVSGRWYYNMGRRMRLGKGGNGLSGNYIAGGLGGYYYSTESQNKESANWNERLLPFFSTGFQRTLGERLYFDIGAGMRQRRGLNNPHTESGRFRMEVFGNAHIGIKF